MSDNVAALREEVESLRKQLAEAQIVGQYGYYFSTAAQSDLNHMENMPLHGRPPETVKAIIENAHALEFNPLLNTSSYVNVSLEEEEEAVALMGLRVNLADQTVYPQSYRLHDTVVNMIARLWHCPEPEDFCERRVFPGAGTVGSTEACLLAGLALKFRWREWYAKRKGIEPDDISSATPNMVVSTCYQAAWEKLFRYMDIEARLVAPSIGTFTIDPEAVRGAIDENTIGVVCIMGNHYGGHYDPVWEVNQVVEELNAQNEFQVGIHVDAASGGFIAPFQDDLPPWDFRLKNVLSISSSGHKYGESCCGTGWIVWRHRKQLSDHVSISVTYLGGDADSYTLNFSRPASGVYVQYYKFLRYGLSGYRQLGDNLMENAKFVREGLRSMTHEGRPRFELLDAGSERCLPVVCARLNPECEFRYDDIDLQHVLAQHQWYVSGYRMSFRHPSTEKLVPLFHDEEPDQTMFRIVVKSNLTRDMAENLLESFVAAFEFLDRVDFSHAHGLELHRIRHKDQVFSNHC